MAAVRNWPSSSTPTSLTSAEPPGSLEQTGSFRLSWSAICPCALARGRLPPSAPEPQLSLWALAHLAVAAERFRDLHQQFPRWIQAAPNLVASAHSQPGRLAAVALAEALQAGRRRLPSESGCELLARPSVSFRQARRSRSDDLRGGDARLSAAWLRQDTVRRLQASCSRRFGSMSACSASGPASGCRSARYYEGPGFQTVCQLRPALCRARMATALLHGLPRPVTGSMPRSVRQPGLPSWP